jgi:hypothetical protein
MLSIMEGYRPVSERDRKMMRLRTQPRAYEHLKLNLTEPVAMPEAERPGMGLLLLGWLSALLNVPEREEPDNRVTITQH